MRPWGGGLGGSFGRGVPNEGVWGGSFGRGVPNEAWEGVQRGSFGRGVPNEAWERGLFGRGALKEGGFLIFFWGGPLFFWGDIACHFLGDCPILDHRIS